MKKNNSATTAAQIIKRGSPHIAFDHSITFPKFIDVFYLGTNEMKYVYEAGRLMQK